MRTEYLWPRVQKDGFFIFLCTTHFPKSYYNQHLIFVEDIENFKAYPRGLDVHKEIRRKLSAQKENLRVIKLA